MHYPEWPRELNDTSKLLSTEFVFSLSAINLRWECMCECLSVRENQRTRLDSRALNQRTRLDS